MAYTYRIYPEHGLVRIVLAGTVSGAELRNLVGQLVDDPGWGPHFDVVWDNRRLDQLALTAADVAEIGSYLKDVGAWIGPGQTAVIVRQEGAAQARRLLEVLGRGAIRERALFYSVEQAQSWLGRALPQ